LQRFALRVRFRPSNNCLDRPFAEACSHDAAKEQVIDMKTFVLKVRRFLAAEDGPTAVEYAVMLALIITVCLVAITSVGSNASTTFSNVGASLGAS
jgi:pilus assembly protein Flp/PilA